MRKASLLSIIVTAFMLVAMTAMPASGQNASIPDPSAEEAVPERHYSSLSEALPSAALPSSPAMPAADPGVIAYIHRNPHEIRLIDPDGTNDRLLWAAPDPDSTTGIVSLAWRPDGRQLAFSSDHEVACSWFESDVYVIGASGTGLRRVTNAPACALLAGYPQGSVTVNVSTLSGWMQVYVVGSSELKSITGSGQVTFNHVADLGPGVGQPAVGIWGLYRAGGLDAPDVLQGQTVQANLWFGTGAESEGFGTGHLSWNSGGTRIGYTMRNCVAARQIAANPPDGAIGADLPVGSAEQFPCLVDLARTADNDDRYLYWVYLDGLSGNEQGLYLASTANPGGITKILAMSDLPPLFGFYDAVSIDDVKWLPDDSGFLFTSLYVTIDDKCSGTCSNVFEYDFGTPPTITQLTQFGDYDHVTGVSISPDAQQLVIQVETDEFPFQTSSIWAVRRDGSDPRKLADNAWAPSWGATPPPQRKVYVPLVTR